MDERAERAILSHAEAYRLVEEARQMRAERDEHAAIVRELAARGPFVNEMGGCETCIVLDGISWTDFIRPANHEPSCIWRLAMALYP